MTDNSDKNDFKATQDWGERMRQEVLDAGYYKESVNISEEDLHNFYEASCDIIESIKSTLELMHSYNPQAVSFYLYGSDLKPDRLANIIPMSFYGNKSIHDDVYNFLLSRHNRDMLCTVLDVTSVETGVVTSTDIHVFKVTF